MTKMIRTTSDNQDFIELVKFLDADLAEKDGDLNSFYSQFNKIDNIRYVLLAYENECPIGCGAIKEFRKDTAEIKRMYVLPGYRQKGIASKILSELENWACELSFTKCILETGKRQKEAVALYKKNGYSSIPNYGQYEGIENSLCFGKEISFKQMII